MLMIKMQLGCLFVLMYIGFYYFKIRRLDIASARIFKIMLFAGATNLVFDAITVYTVNHLEQVPALLNRVCHQFFIGTLDLFIFLICCYILSIVEGKRELTRVGKVLLVTPLAVSAVMVLFAPLSYNTTAEVAYSYGPMAITCYASVGIYLVLALKYIIQYWGKIQRKKREAILPVLLLMICISTFQLFQPTALISGIGVTLILLGIFMAMENPAEYLTGAAELFNEKAFAMVTGDRVRRKKAFAVIGIAYREEALLEERYGKAGYEALILQLNAFVSEKTALSLYVSQEGYLTLVVDDEKRVSAVMNALKERFLAGWEIGEDRVHTELGLSSFSHPHQFATVQELADILKVQMEGTRWNIAYIDRNLGIQNRNGFERICDFLYKNRLKFTSIWYLMADVNDLKVVNDTMGHLAGDKLLQDCADVLAEAAEAGTDVYRIGGDEFAILLVSKTAEQVAGLVERIEQCRARCNESRRTPLSFAVGYSNFQPERDGSLQEMMERADREMYERKLEMKRGETAR